MELWQKKQKAPSFRAAARAAKSKAIPNNDIHELVRPPYEVIKAFKPSKGSTVYNKYIYIYTFFFSGYADIETHVWKMLDCFG